MGAILYRAACLGDSRGVARLITLSGGGLYEYLFEELVPFVSAADFLAMGVASLDEPISHRNCQVAVDDELGGILGVANVFPASVLQAEGYPLLPAERLDHVSPILRLQDRDSLLLNALAVERAHRKRGIGGRLLQWALNRAREVGLPRLSLHVWEDNVPAREYYKERGFAEIGVAEIAACPRLAHRRSILMSRASLGASS